jgi:tripartite-type tricarboxylate transporter receptor subunit TctC
MKLPRRQFLHLAAGAAALPAVSRFAWAQTYPTRPVRMIVPFPPGGQIDIIGRLIGHWLSERLGQQFFVDNRPGAAGNIGTEAAVRAAADGHTLLLASVTNAVNATLFEKLNFDFIRDTAPVASINRIPRVLEVPRLFSNQNGARIDRLRQGQSGQDQHRNAPQGNRTVYGGRVVYDDGRRRIGSRALSGVTANAD